MIALCGGPDAIQFPDAGDGACCWGAAVYGAQRCTCWKPVYDRRQRKPRTDLVGSAQQRPCLDCAYRQDSPERTGQPGFACNEPGELEALVTSGQPFYCHQGVRRVVRWRHPSGLAIDAHPGSYEPLLKVVQDEGSVVRQRGHKANGTPMDLCAGWLARRLAFMQRAGS